MYYRLDQDLEEFLTYVYTLFKPHEVLVILTSDHGSSPSYDFGREACDRFNTRQFEVIVTDFSAPATDRATGCWSTKTNACT